MRSWPGRRFGAGGAATSASCSCSVLPCPKCPTFPSGPVLRRRASSSRRRRWPGLGPSTSRAPAGSSRREGARCRPGQQAGKRRDPRSPACARGRAGPCRSPRGPTCSWTTPPNTRRCRVTSSTTSPAGSAGANALRRRRMLPHAGPPATIAWQGSHVEEEVVELGRSGLVGILTRPSSGVPRGTVVWLKFGLGTSCRSRPGLGGIARTLALSGCASIRVDFSGWGESPDLGHAPGRPYDAHGVDGGGSRRRPEEVGTPRHRPGRPLCGSLDRPPCRPRGRCRGRPGPQSTDLLAARLPRGSQHRHRDACPPVGRNPPPQAARGPGRVVVPRRPRARPPAARWLGALARRQTPILAVFAEGDDGLQYIQDRTARAWRRAIAPGLMQVTTVAGIDHPMHRHWKRPSMVDAISAWLDTVIPASAIVGTVGQGDAPARNGS